MIDQLAALLSSSSFPRMGHGQSENDDNLGMGWLYYALTRIYRPRLAVVIGSYRGFVPILIAKGLQDNAEGGELIFLDPSYVDEFWSDPQAVTKYFNNFELDNVRHFKMTTAEFCQSSTYRDLQGIGIVFIDGLHTYDKAKADFESFEHKLSKDGVMLLHDTASVAIGTIYGPGKGYIRNVPRLINELRKRQDLQVFDIHVAAGVALVNRIPIPS